MVLKAFLVVCMVLMGSWVEATWWKFAKKTKDLPPLTLPNPCGDRAESENITTMPVSEENSNNSSTDFAFDMPWPWVVRVNEEAAGVMLSQQHLITPAHCLYNYKAWYGGYYGFSVRVGEELVEVQRVQIQYSTFPLAILTLSTKQTWITTPVCIGAVQEGLLLAAAVGWNGTTILREAPLPIRRENQCKDYYEDYYDESLMVCGAPGPGDCGAPLLQAVEERWMLVGVGVGDKTLAARYIRLEPAREWLEA